MTRCTCLVVPDGRFHSSTRQIDFKMLLNSFSTSSQSALWSEYLLQSHFNCLCILSSAEYHRGYILFYLHHSPSYIFLSSLTLPPPWTHCETVQRLCSVFPHLPLMASDAPQLPGLCSHPANTPRTNGRIKHTHLDSFLGKYTKL